MYPLVESYLAGSKTREAFCAEHGLSLATFAYWRGKYGRDQVSSGGFVEIRRPESPPTEKAHVEVLYPSGIRVRLFSAVTPAYVTGLVAGERR
jgi:hypothetical protein